MTDDASATVDQLIGDQVHQLLWQQRKTQRELADAIGLVQASVSRKLRGERPWSAEELIRAAAFLEVTAGDLMAPAEASRRAQAAVSTGVPVIHA